MTFDEWWEEYWPKPTEPSVCDAVLKDLSQKVWIAATAAERERCARMAKVIGSGTTHGTGTRWACTD